MANPMEPVSIDGIAFDAWIDSEEKWGADVPSFPVESGFEVSDAIILRPVHLSMTLFLTNTPVTFRQLHGASPHRVQDVIDRLRQLYFRKEPVTVSTSEADYENMAITSIGLPKKLGTGTAKEIPITFQQIRTVEAATTAVPASLGRGGLTGVNAGTANAAALPIPAQPAEREADGSRGSVLYNLSGMSGLLDGALGRLDGLFGRQSGAHGNRPAGQTGSLSGGQPVGQGGQEAL